VGGRRQERGRGIRYLSLTSEAACKKEKKENSPKGSKRMGDGTLGGGKSAMINLANSQTYFIIEGWEKEGGSRPKGAERKPD